MSGQIIVVETPADGCWSQKPLADEGKERAMDYGHRSSWFVLLRGLNDGNRIGRSNLSSSYFTVQKYLTSVCPITQKIAHVGVTLHKWAVLLHSSNCYGKRSKLSNDDALRLTDDRLTARKNVCHLSTNKFWQTMQMSSGYELFNLAMTAMPKFHEMIRVKLKYSRKLRRVMQLTEIGKGDACEFIGQYNKKAKETASLIHQYLYGVGKDSTKKSDRLVSKEDLLLEFTVDPGVADGIVIKNFSYNGVIMEGFYNVNAEEAWSQKDLTPPATILALKSFCNYDPNSAITSVQIETDPDSAPGADSDSEEEFDNNNTTDDDDE